MSYIHRVVHTFANRQTGLSEQIYVKVLGNDVA